MCRNPVYSCVGGCAKKEGDLCVFVTLCLVVCASVNLGILCHMHRHTGSRTEQLPNLLRRMVNIHSQTMGCV